MLTNTDLDRFVNNTYIYAFSQSDLHCIQVTVSTFYQVLLSLGIEPMILALLTPCHVRDIFSFFTSQQFMDDHM